ncbi:MAG: helix-turn-helix domain-containing protein [Firmicutes bacterium]|nr:helix-turn-helix domain-containing protein [Bacillota bacterium]
MEKIHHIDVEKVKQIMAQKGIDHKALAQLMGVTLPTVQKFLNGACQRHMTLKKLIKIRNALGVDLRDILHPY